MIDEKARYRLAGGVLILLALLFLARLSWQGDVVGLVADDAAYILLADYFSPYSSATRHAATFIAHHGVFPPLYPLTLALAGAGADAIWWSHVLTTMMMLAAMIFAARLLLASRVPAGLALAYASLLFLMPRSLLQHLELLSEPLFLALSLSALLLAQSADGVAGRRIVLWVGMLTGLAVMTRTAGVALVAAFVIWQFAAGHKQRVWPAILAAVLPLVLWELIKPLVYAQKFVEYSQQLWVTYPLNDLPRAAARLGQGVADLWRGWREFLDLKPGGGSLPAAVLLTAGAVPGWVVRLQARSLEAIYFPLYLGMIVVWPFPEHTARFLYPVVPLLLYFNLVSVQLLPRMAWRYSVHVLLLGTTLLAILPSTGQMLAKLAADKPAALGSYAQTRVLYANESPMPAITRNAAILGELATAMRESRNHVPSDQCVYTTHFEMYMFYARRYARPIVPQDVANKVLSNAPACRYLLVNFANSHPDFRPGYPLPDAQLNAALVYEHRAPGAGNAEGPLVAQLLLLMTPEELETARGTGTLQ